ncbi:MAG TPA: 2-hydroxyacyl-CoA dehydratase [Clostridia bacterium]|nr:2-hydroxyacyl-CoA dehydratase [Clostridia bacterium]
MVKDLVKEEIPLQSKLVGWFCTYTPLEVIVAAGFQPFRIFGSSERIAEAGVYLPPNLCPYVRACLGEAFLGRFDGIAGVVLVHSCNAMGQLASAWRRYTNVPVIAEVHIPRDSDSKAMVYMLSQVRSLIRGLERAGGTVTVDSLLTAIRTSWAIRAGWNDLLAKQRRVPAFYSGAGLSRLGRSLQRAGPDQAKALLDLPRQTEYSDTTTRTGNNPRFILTGSVVSPGLLDLLDSVGADVVYDETCSCGRALFSVCKDVKHGVEGALLESAFPRIDPNCEGASELDTLIEYLASWYLNRIPCARMKPAGQRIRYLVSLAKEYSAQGVISSVVKFCDPYLYEQPLLRQALLKEGIPYLLIEHEYEVVPEGRLLTRLEAFIEKTWRPGRSAI